MITINATIHTSTEKDPWIITFNPDNGCVSLMLAGDNYSEPFVQLYGTHADLTSFLGKALSEVLAHSTKDDPNTNFYQRPTKTGLS